MGSAGASGVTPHERFRAWLVTGPLGRFAAMVIEIGAALGRALPRRG
jgi:hypothetical protein